MKNFLAFFLLASTCFALDKNGFATCYEHQGETYFFEWDHFINTPLKKVNYFTLREYVSTTGHLIRNCEDQKYIHEIPQEILKDIDGIKAQLPADIIQSLLQISEGAHVYHTEKTGAEYIANRPGQFKRDQPEVLTQLRQQAGDLFASEVMNLFIDSIIHQSDSCAALIGTCDFYLCQEKKNPCGLDGYNLNFGYKYCSGSKFKLLKEMKTDLGKSWVTDVFTCLQKRSLETSSIVLEDENKCHLIKKLAYQSHPDCYVQAGFCKLKGLEKHQIFNLIKKEIISFQTITQGIELIKQCEAEK